MVGEFGSIPSSEKDAQSALLCPSLVKDRSVLLQPPPMAKNGGYSKSF